MRRESRAGRAGREVNECQERASGGNVDKEKTGSPVT